MTEDFYITLIYKKISGEINDQEKVELDKWLAESEDNQLTYKSVELAWNSTPDDNPVPDVDLDKEFSFLEESLGDDISKEEEKNEVEPEEKQIPKRSINTRILWRTIAASVVVIFAIGFLVQNYFLKPSMQWVEVTTQDNIKSIELSDKTKVKLNRNSSFKYPKEFTGNQRLVRLKGEAFFDVSHNPNHPFVIETKQERIKVLGTSFNVMAYEKKQYASVYVVTGKVQLTTKRGSDKVILEKGNKGILDRKSQQLNKIEQASSNEISWSSRQLKFVDTPFREVIKQAERMYYVDFEITNANLNKCPFTATFINQDIDVFLETISAVLDVEVVKIGDKSYQLNGGNCE